MRYILPLVMILSFAVMIAGSYLNRRWQEKYIPAPVRHRGQQIVLIYAVGMIAILGLLTIGIWAIFNQPIVSSIIIAFGIVLIFCFTGCFISWLHGRATRGRLLLDCGPFPTKKPFFFEAALFLLLFGGIGLDRFLEKSDMWGIAGILFGVTMAIFRILAASGRLQIRENGIWHYWGLLKWDRLQSYKWEGDSLLIDRKTRFPFLGKGALPVPSEHKTSIEGFLAKHCPAQCDA